MIQTDGPEIVVAAHRKPVKIGAQLLEPAGLSGGLLARAGQPDEALGRALDRLYRKKGFVSERDRVEHLFMLGERLQAPAAAAAKRQHVRRKKRVNAAAEPG